MGSKQTPNRFPTGPKQVQVPHIPSSICRIQDPGPFGPICSRGPIRVQQWSNKRIQAAGAYAESRFHGPYAGSRIQAGSMSSTQDPGSMGLLPNPGCIGPTQDLGFMNPPQDPVSMMDPLQDPGYMYPMKDPGRFHGPM